MQISAIKRFLLPLSRLIRLKERSLSAETSEAKTATDEDMLGNIVFIADGALLDEALKGKTTNGEAPINEALVNEDSALVNEALANEATKGEALIDEALTNESLANKALANEDYCNSDTGPDSEISAKDYSNIAYDSENEDFTATDNTHGEINTGDLSGENESGQKKFSGEKFHPADESAYEDSTTVGVVRTHSFKEHLKSSVPRSARPPQGTLTKGELAEIRSLFGSIDDAEIYRLYKRVTK